MQINHSELTRSALQPKLKAEGIIFMAESGNEEIPTNPQEIHGSRLARLRDKAKEQLQRAGEKIGGKSAQGESVILSQFQKIGIPEELIQDPLFQAFANEFAKQVGRDLAHLSKEAILRRFQHVKEEKAANQASGQEPVTGGSSGGAEPPRGESQTATGDGEPPENGNGSEDSFSASSGISQEGREFASGQEPTGQDRRSEDLRGTEEDGGGEYSSLQSEFLASIKQIFEDPIIRAELAKDGSIDPATGKPNLPDFSRPEMQPLHDFIRRLEPQEDKFAYFTGVITYRNMQNIRMKSWEQTQTNDEGEVEMENGKPKKIIKYEYTMVHGSSDEGNINISELSRKVIFEELVERIISIPDATPDSTYNIGGLYITSALDNLRVAVEAQFEDKDKGFERYIKQLIEIRAVAHEFGKSLEVGEAYTGYINEHLRTSGLHFMFSEIAGVSEAFALYEKASTHRVQEAKSWWDDGDSFAVRKQVRNIYESLYEKGFITAKDGRKLTDWEMERAIRIADIFFAGTQRMAMYAAQGDVPSMLATSKRIGSVPYEYIVRKLIAFKITAPRFFSNEHSGSKALLTHVFEWQRKLLQGEKEGEKGFRDGFKDEFKDDQFKGLFGLDERTMILNSYGAFDALSQSWRIPLLLFGNLNTVVDGRRVTFLDHINQLVVKYGGDLGDTLLGGKDIKGKKKAEFSEAVERLVLSERLYYSGFAKFGSFDRELKQKIWQKSAILRPSALVALMPELIYGGKWKELNDLRAEGDKGFSEDKLTEIMDLEAVKNPVWHSLREKLIEEEQIRIMEDAALLERYNRIVKQEGELSPEDDVFRRRYEVDRETEYVRFLESEDQIKTGQGDYAFQILNRLKARGNLEPEEERMLKDIIINGYNNAARELAMAKMPFSYCIDDAPFISWKKTGDGLAGLANADLIRIIVSDQAKFSEGWTALNSIVESPKLNKVIELFNTGVEGIGNVVGRKDAQAQLEPFYLAWMQMARTKEGILWTPFAKTIFRVAGIPTSEMEKYFRESKISFDEKDRWAWWDAMAIANNVSDNVEKTGLKASILKADTQLGRMKKESRSGRMRLLARWIRIISMLFGPNFAKTFLKQVIPPDLAKGMS